MATRTAKSTGYVQKAILDAGHEDLMERVKGGITMQLNASILKWFGIETNFGVDDVTWSPSENEDGDLILKAEVDVEMSDEQAAKVDAVTAQSKKGH